MSKTVLVAEDDDSLISIYQSIFKNEPYRLIIADDGEEAIQKAQEEQPDLIILDTILPKKSGEEVVAELSKNKETNTIPLIILSNRSSEELGELKKFQNVAEIIMKVDLDIDSLQRKIRTYLT